MLRSTNFFAEYVYGFIWGDVERTIKARVNYGAALMLLNYTEVLGGLANGKLGKKNAAGEYFRDGLILMKWKGDAKYYHGFRVLLTDGTAAPREAEPWEVFRCGLAHHGRRGARRGQHRVHAPGAEGWRQDHGRRKGQHERLEDRGQHRGRHAWISPIWCRRVQT
jgi:hypothetical protein